MTTAAKATPKSAAASPRGDAKALRVGVVFNGQLIHEEVFTRPRALTIGYERGNSVPTPWAAGVIGRPLFDYRDGRYHLRLGQDMGGRITRDGKVHEVAQVRSGARNQGVAEGNDILVKLDGNTSGRIKIAEATVLFQFVAPPTGPNPLAAVSPTQSLVKSFDWFLANLFIFSVVLHLGVVLGSIKMAPPPRDPFDTPVAKANVELIAAPLVEEPPPPVEEKAADVAEPVAVAEKPKEAAPALAPKKDAPPPDPNKVKAQREDKVARQTIIRYFATTDGDSNMVVDRAMTARLNQAFDGTPGIVSDSGDSRAGAPLVTLQDANAPSIQGISDAEMAARPREAVGSGEKAAEVKIRSKIKADAASEVFGTGTLDKDAVAGVFRRRIGAVKACYERELKQDPSVAGKIVIQFTIEERGRISAAKVLSDTTGQDRIGKCIVANINSWRFPTPEGGSVTVSYPLVFQPAS